MNRKWSRSFLDRIEPDFKLLGFTLSKGQQRFTRYSSNRSDIFQLAFWDEEMGLQVGPTAGVRFDEVEDIFHRTSGFEPEYQKGTFTVGVDLWHDEQDKCHLVMQGEADVACIGSQVLSVLRDKAEPYFSHFSDLSAVDLAINNQPTEPCIHVLMPWLRCSRGVIIAKLVGRKNFDELASVYRSVMQADNRGYYLPKFDALLNDLANW